MPADLESHIRDLGDYVEKQMKDLLDTKKGVTGSALRIAFRAVVGTQIMDSIMRYESMDYTNFGLKPREGWLKDLQRVVDYAEANNSDAAEKIKKALPIATELTKEFGEQKVNGIRAKIKYAKAKGINY
jgi:hypothetical protein